MVDTNELLQLINARCEQMRQILDDCRKDSGLTALAADILEPMLQEICEKQEQIRSEPETTPLEHPSSESEQ